MKRIGRVLAMLSILWLNPLSLWDEWAKSGAYLLQYLYGYAEAQAECTLSGGGLSALGSSASATLGGKNGSNQPDANAEFRFRLRNDFTLQPAADCSCAVAFNDNLPNDNASQQGFELDDSVQPPPGDECGFTVYTTFDAQGVGHFRVPGFAGPLTTGHTTIGGARFWYKLAGQQWTPLWFTTRVSAYDLNGQDGVTVADLAVFSSDKALYDNNHADYRQRSDFNGDGQITVADLSLFSIVKNGGGSTVSATECIENPAARTDGVKRSWGSVKAGYR